MPKPSQGFLLLSIVIISVSSLAVGLLSNYELWCGRLPLLKCEVSNVQFDKLKVELIPSSNHFEELSFTVVPKSAPISNVNFRLFKVEENSGTRYEYGADEAEYPFVAVDQSSLDKGRLRLNLQNSEDLNPGIYTYETQGYIGGEPVSGVIHLSVLVPRVKIIRNTESAELTTERTERRAIITHQRDPNVTARIDVRLTPYVEGINLGKPLWRNDTCTFDVWLDSSFEKSPDAPIRSTAQFLLGNVEIGSFEVYVPRFLVLEATPPTATSPTVSTKPVFTPNRITLGEETNYVQKVNFKRASREALPLRIPRGIAIPEEGDSHLIIQYDIDDNFPLDSVASREVAFLDQDDTDFGEVLVVETVVPEFEVRSEKLSVSVGEPVRLKLRVKSPQHSEIESALAERERESPVRLDQGMVRPDQTKGTMAFNVRFVDVVVSDPKVTFQGNRLEVVNPPQFPTNPQYTFKNDSTSAEEKTYLKFTETTKSVKYEDKVPLRDALGDEWKHRVEFWSSDWESGDEGILECTLTFSKTGEAKIYTYAMFGVKVFKASNPNQLKPLDHVKDIVKAYPPTKSDAPRGMQNLPCETLTISVN